MSTAEKYWGEPPDRHTKIKSSIVLKYFKVWSKIIRQRQPRLVYLDLFAGMGQHESGHLSTAMQVLEWASGDSFLRDNLTIFLNDKIQRYTRDIERVLVERKLREEFAKDILVRNFEVDTFTPESLKEIISDSTFCFIDPLGFKGITLKLIKLVTQNWGCDCVLFFNTSGINRNIELEPSAPHLTDLFGAEHLASVRQRKRRGHESNEHIVLDQFRIACQEIGAKYFLPFQMNFENTDGISHHLIFLSKNWLGFAIMKDVMAEYSTEIDSVPRYICKDIETMQIEFSLDGPMESLKRQLMQSCSGEELQVKQIVENCHRRGLLFTTKNIKDGLVRLENEKKIQVVSVRGSKRRMGTMGDTCFVTFPGANINGA